MSDRIEAALAREDWRGARKIILEELKDQPDSHWLITRLSVTFYEEHDYVRALRYAQEALSLQPTCPLAQWDAAGALHMLGRYDEAIAMFETLVRRGAKRIARGNCGEGLAHAPGLVADCWYRISECHRSTGRESESRQAFTRHLVLRGPGCRSIYPLKDIGGSKSLSDLRKTWKHADPRRPKS